ncbi:MAG TPA: DUF883 family protein [Usitatibacter sp.]|nr:DUF883 family protein [Usitatibacter sp.]
MSQIQSDIRTDATKERLFEEFNSVVTETESLLKSLAGASGDKAGALQARVAQQLADAGDRIAKIREEAIGQANAAARATNEYVQENPWLVIGVVAAAAGVTGLVAGFLVARR